MVLFSAAICTAVGNTREQRQRRLGAHTVTICTRGCSSYHVTNTACELGHLRYIDQCGRAVDASLIVFAAACILLIFCDHLLHLKEQAGAHLRTVRGYDKHKHKNESHFCLLLLCTVHTGKAWAAAAAAAAAAGVAAAVAAAACGRIGARMVRGVRSTQNLCSSKGSVAAYLVVQDPEHLLAHIDVIDYLLLHKPCRVRKQLFREFAKLRVSLHVFI